jgi:hypothetical protein
LPGGTSKTKPLDSLGDLSACRAGSAPIIITMDLDAIVESIDAEISRMEKARALLTGHTAPLKRGFPPTKRRTMSAEGRARIAAAQRKRWAKRKRK